MHITFFAVTKILLEEQGNSKPTKMKMQLLFKGNGNNLRGFMIGRQLTIASYIFFVAQMTSIKIAKGVGNMFSTLDRRQKLSITSLLRVLFLKIVGLIA